MQNQIRMGLLGLLALCHTAFAAALAVDDRPVAAEKSVVADSTDLLGPSADLAIDGEEPGLSVTTPVLVPPGTVFKKVIVGPDGSVTFTDEVEAIDEGVVAGPGERKIYENTLGINTTNFPNNQPVSDDISTTAPDGCNLTRYRFKVLGKVLPAGVGGAYTVTYGLYTNCPLAVGSNNATRDLVRIPGTEGVIAFPDESPATIEHVVPALTPVALPNNVYLSLRFSRSNCGTVVGAPAMIGFSGDIWDFPGFPCNGFLGGFPQLPHASFWLEMFGTTNCPAAYSGYKCQRPSGGTATPGANIQAVDDIKLAVNNCQMVGYEVTVRGVGFYTFDLRRECSGSIIAGTQRTFSVNASTTPQLQVARFTFNPPIALTTDSMYFGFKSSSNTGGAVIAGIQPIIGESTLDYFIQGLEGCAPVIPTQGVHGAVNLAITCAGAQPIGACCDPHLTECNAGEDLGKRCASNADCNTGTCEAVCRETTLLNCPFPPRGQDLRPTWIEGAACNPDPFGNNPCGVAACCHLRPNASNPSLLDEVCSNRTKNGCAAEEPTDAARLWQLGQYCGVAAQECPRNACLARDGSCYVAHPGAGCSDPFCCSDICDIGTVGAFCCNTSWDAACVALAEQYCSQAPPNDQCAPDFPVRGLQGALTIPFPGSAATSNLKATESPVDFGFCCHNGKGSCVGGLDPGLECIVDNDCPDSPGNPATCTPRTPEPGSTGYGSIWFKWVQGSGTTAGISTCTSNSPALDSILQVYEANDSSTPLTACNTLSVIACNDDAINCSSTNRNSRICLRNLTPNKTYYVLLAAKTNNRRGQYIVTMSDGCTGPNQDPIVNDYCRNASAITDATPADPLVVPFATGRFCLSGAGAGLPCTSDAQCRVCEGGFNAGMVCTGNANCPNGSCPLVPSGVCPPSGAVATFDCPAASCSTGARNDVWFNYTATCTGDATFSTCGSGNPDTAIAVYDGCTTCPNASNNSSFMTNGCNADNNQAGCLLPGRVVVPVVQGQCYKVRIADNGLPMAGKLTITCSGVQDCNTNGIEDALDIANCPPGTGPASCQDCNNNQQPDICDIPPDTDCQPNGIPDLCELAGNDCQPDGIPDDCGGTQGCDGCPNGVVTFVNPSIVDPLIGALDAGRPFPPNTPGSPEGWGVFTVTGPPGATSNCFSLCETAFSGGANAIQSAVEGPAGTYTITLSRPITTNATTTITYTPDAGAPSVGVFKAHPGNVNADGVTAPTDILSLIDHLNNLTLVPQSQCDVDRSGLCAPADLTTLIDLLNGVTGYTSQLNSPKPPDACP